MKRPSNIEELLVDYADGNLSAEDLLIVEQWLKEHPEDLNLVMEWDKYSLDELSNEKHNIKRLNVDEDVEDLMLLELEGRLSSEQEDQLNELCEASIPLSVERQIYQLTKLDPTRDHMVFSDKESLKKSQVITFNRRRAFYYLSAAASLIAIFFSLNILFDVDSQYRPRTASEFPKGVEVEVEDLPMIELSVSSKNSTQIAQSTSFKEERTSLPAKSKTVYIVRLKPRSITSVNYKFEQSPSLAMRSEKANRTSPVEYKSNDYSGVMAFIQDKVLEKLPIEIKNKKLDHIIEDELPKYTQGKYSLSLDEGKLIAFRTPIVEFSR